MNRPDVDTWYVLADGTKAHPADVSADEAGVLKHSNGVPVALRENGLPLTTGDANRENAMAADAGKTSGGLADMTIAQLKDLAAERAIDLGEATKKADIIAAIEAAPAAHGREMKPSGAGPTYQTR
jgi:hypothetical protein